MMLCSMCPTVVLSKKKAPGFGWQCATCTEINCAHIGRCKCGQSRYDQEKSLKRPVNLQKS